MRYHQAAIFRFAYLLLGDASDAEDVAQETFIRAFRALATFEVEHPLRPSLLQITKNLAYNHRRSVRRYTTALTCWFQVAPKIAPALESFDPQHYWAIPHFTDEDAPGCTYSYLTYGW